MPMNGTTPAEDKLLSLKRVYATLRPPATLSLPELPFSLFHHFLLHSLLLDTHFKDYPPSKQYQKVFWKWAIRSLESHVDLLGDEDLEIDSRLYDHYTYLLASQDPSNITSPSSSSGPPAPSFLTYYWSFSPVNAASNIVAELTPVTLMESRTTIEGGTTGLRTWLASFILGAFLITHQEIVAGKRVLELGSGTGLLGIITATLQLSTPGSLWLTDVDENVLARCKQNVELPCNQSSAHTGCHYLPLDWADALAEEHIPRLRHLFNTEVIPDVIIGADLVFDPCLIPPLIATLYLLLQSHPERSAIIALTVRNEETVVKFINSAEEKLQVEEINFDRETVTAFEVPQGGTDANLGVKIFNIQSMN